MNPEIYKFVKDLTKETEKIADEQKKADALFWLLEAARVYEGDDRLISSLEVASQLILEPPEAKVMSGFKGIDDILDGFRKKQLIVVSAATKSGKTSFCIDLTANMKAENPLWLPFEEGARELVQKFLDRGEQPPLFYTPQVMLGNTLIWVEKRIIEAKAKFGASVVFIDHLHFIVDFGENMSLQIGRTMRELKRLAKQWDVTIFLIAHLKKTEMGLQPTLEDLRDSSFIAQEADTVLMLWRECRKESGQVVITDNVNVSIQANRRTGKTGNVKMVFEKGKFLEKQWTDPEMDDFVKPVSRSYKKEPRVEW